MQQDDSFKSKIAMFNTSGAKEPPPDPFQTEDPFKSDPFKGPQHILESLCYLHLCICRDEDDSPLNTWLKLFLLLPE